MDDESYGLDGAPWPILGADGQILPRRAKEKWDGHPWPGWAPGVESGGEIVAGKEEGDDKAEEKAGTAEVEAKLATA